MTVFFNSLKRLFKSKVQLLVLFILPFLVLFPTNLVSSGTMTTLKIAIIDKDNTELTKTFAESAKRDFSVVNVNEKDIDNSINDGDINYVIVIPKGYTSGIINMRDVKMKGFASSDKNVSSIMKEVIDGYMNPVKNIAAASKGDNMRFYSGFKVFKQAFFKELGKTKNKPAEKNSIVIYGMIIMFSMFTPVFAATTIITDKEKKTFFRTLNAGLSLKSYMLQTILSFELIAISQIAILLTVSKLCFHIEFGSSILNMLLLMFIFSIVSVSFGIAVSSMSKSTIQATMIGVGTVTFMSVIGGAWGMKPNSGVVDVLSKLIPVSWAVDGIQKLLNNENLSSIGQNIVMLLIFAMIFFLLGTWRKADIVK